MKSLMRNGSELRYQLLRDFREDAIRVQAHQCVVESNTLLDTYAEVCPDQSVAAHRDAIQLIPPPPVPGLYNHQYAGAMLQGGVIQNNHIHAMGSQLQGVFASDGLFDGLCIAGNVIDTNSQHHITINGLRSGYIAHNYQADGLLAKIRFYPLRLGGWVDDTCVWVLGFLHDQDEYQPVECIIKDSTSSHVTDLRRVISYPNHTYLADFDLTEWQVYAPTLHASDAVSLCRLVQSAAKQFGNEVYLT